MTKKLYTVCVEVEILVYAETHEIARRVASYHFRDEAKNVSSDDFAASETTMYKGKPVLPGGWNGDCLVYGSDRSVNEITAELVAQNTEEER